MSSCEHCTCRPVLPRQRCRVDDGAEISGSRLLLKLGTPDVEALCGNNLYHLYVGFGPLEVTSQRSHVYGGGLPQ